MFLFVLIALLVGFAVGWGLGARPLAVLRGERDAMRGERDAMRGERDLMRGERDLMRGERDGHFTQFKQAIVDLEGAAREREGAKVALARAESERDARDAAFEARVSDLQATEARLLSQFRELGGQVLGEAQASFLKRADERFAEAGASNAERVRALLQPVESTLRRYEEGLTRVEKDRADSYGALREAVEHVKAGLGETRAETAKLVNALRAAPKTRGRWGEQQFRNLIELAGLAGHVDFAAEVSVAAEDGALRPDFIINLPGGQQLIVDVKCVLEAYMQAVEAVSPEERRLAMDAHARAVRGHAEALSRKAYWAQFAQAPDFVIMYVPGDNFLSAALEHDLELWERAARNRVIIAGPSAFLPLARTVAQMWRQQKLTEDAREVGKLGKEMYERLATAAGHLKRVGGGLNTAVDNYNKFLSSFEGRVMVSARRFQALNVDVGNAQLESVEPVDAVARAPTLELTDAADTPARLPGAG